MTRREKYSTQRIVGRWQYESTSLLIDLKCSLILQNERKNIQRYKLINHINLNTRNVLVDEHIRIDQSRIRRERRWVAARDAKEFNE